MYKCVFQVRLRWKDVASIAKEKTALVIPNAIEIATSKDTDEKYFFTSFLARDRAYLMLFKLWQNALLDQVSNTHYKQYFLNFSKVVTLARVVPFSSSLEIKRVHMNPEISKSVLEIQNGQKFLNNCDGLNWRVNGESFSAKNVSKEKRPTTILV